MSRARQRAGAVIERGVQIEQLHVPLCRQLPNRGVGLPYGIAGIRSRQDGLQHDNCVGGIKVEAVEDRAQPIDGPRRWVSIADVIGAREDEHGTRPVPCDRLRLGQQLSRRVPGVSPIDDRPLRQQHVPFALLGDAVSEQHDRVGADRLALGPPFPLRPRRHEEDAGEEHGGGARHHDHPSSHAARPPHGSRFRQTTNPLRLGHRLPRGTRMKVTKRRKPGVGVSGHAGGMDTEANSVLIHDGIVLPMDGGRTVHDPGSVLVVDGVIAAVGPTRRGGEPPGRCHRAGDRRVDARRDPRAPQRSPALGVAQGHGGIDGALGMAREPRRSRPPRAHARDRTRRVLHGLHRGRPGRHDLGARHVAVHGGLGGGRRRRRHPGHARAVRR